MGAILGFLVGYYIGTREGREGFQQLVESWNYVSQTDEFEALVATAGSMASEMARQGLSQRLGGGRPNGRAMVPALAEGVVDLLARRRAA